VIKYLVALGVPLCLAAPAAGRNALAAQFGACEGVQISLSPDGGHIALIQPTGGRGAALMVGDLVNGDDLEAILHSSGSRIA
jgi:hypothetical protein